MFLFSCSIGTSFKINEIKSFKGTLIPELSDEPILIEKVTKDLVIKERNNTKLNLPLNLLNYSPGSYKMVLEMNYSFMFMEKPKGCQHH